MSSRSRREENNEAVPTCPTVPETDMSLVIVGLICSEVLAEFPGTIAVLKSWGSDSDSNVESAKESVSRAKM